MNDTVLYLEADEDITSAIDKLSKTTVDSVQIVVPKRSTMLQSIINQKLLKKAAADSGKQLVLVTNDRIAKNLAASVGLAVASSVGAEAVITSPEAHKAVSNEDIIEEDDDAEADDAKKAAALAAAAAVAAPAIARKKVDDKPAAAKPAVPFPVTSDPAAADAAVDPATTEEPAGAPADKADKKSPKVPNFGVMKRRLLWLGAAVMLVVGYFVAMALFTKATVTMYAIGTKVDIDTSFWVNPNATKSDIPSSTLMGQNVTLTKDLTGSVTPTGKKDAGTKATGTMTVSNGLGMDQVLVAGTRFTAPDGKIFRSDEDITVPRAGLNGNGDIVKGTKTVGVTADQAGDSYNEAPAAYLIPGLSNPKVTAQGGQMSGGTTKQITIVTQGDVDKTQADLLAKDKEGAEKELAAKVPSGYMALTSSFASTVNSSTPNPAVDAEATTGSLTVRVTYSELAVPKADYEELITNQEQNQVGAKNEIYQSGLDAGQVTLAAKNSSGYQGFRFTTVAYAGPKYDKAKIANDIKGKRYGDAVDIVSKYPGIQRAEVVLWPSWATKLPGNAAKITINIQIANSK